MRSPLLLQVTLSLFAAAGIARGQCSFTLSSTSSQAPATGSTGSFSITASLSTCVRTASSNASWLTVTFGQTGTGSGSVGYRIDANPTYASRTGTISVSGAVFSVIQAGLPCPAASFTPGGQAVQPSGGSFSISITSPCGWTASSDSGWITVSNNSGVSDGVLSFTVAANNTGAPRSGNITINGSQFSVAQSSIDCSFTISAMSINVGAAGGSNQISVTTSNAGCAWGVQNTASWITNLTIGGKPATTWTGTGTLSFTVAANNAQQSRTATLAISNQIITVTQAGNVCSLTLTPPSAGATAAASNGTFAIAPSNTTCTWTASSNSSWIAVTSGSKGSASGTVGYSVDGNVATTSRSGSITATPAGAPPSTFNIAQDACTATPALAPQSQSAGAAGGNYSIAVTSTCTWTAVPNAAWIAINAGSGTTGNGTVSYTVSPNNTASSRAAAITINQQSFPVTQSGIGSTGIGISFTPQSIVNGASFQPGPVAPGELISIFGSGLGPAQAVGLQTTPDGRSLMTSLGGTRVLFDGKAVPLTYVSATQVNAIVPFRVAGTTGTQVVVEVQGVPSNSAAVSVLAAAPSIFAVSGGTGQGAILNQDNSPNSATNPAAPGSVLQIFATGFGQTNPSGVDGLIAGADIAAPVQKVTATVGGLDAAVQYAGSSNGLVAGVTQINVAIPLKVQTGSAVPVVLNVGGVASTSTVTVAVR